MAKEVFIKITGGNPDYIGHHYYAELLSNGVAVITYNDKSTGTYDPENFEIVEDEDEDDIEDIEDWDGIEDEDDYDSGLSYTQQCFQDRSDAANEYERNGGCPIQAAEIRAGA